MCYSDTLRNQTCKICRVRFETQGLLPKPAVLEEKKLFTKSRFSPNSHFPLPTDAATLSEQKKSQLPSLEFQNREVLEKKNVSPFASFKQGLYSMIIQGFFLETWHLREKARKKCMSRLDTMFTIKPHILAFGLSGYRQYKGYFVAILIPRYQSNRSPKYLLCKKRIRMHENQSTIHLVGYLRYSSFSFQLVYSIPFWPWKAHFQREPPRVEEASKTFQSRGHLTALSEQKPQFWRDC